MPPAFPGLVSSGPPVGVLRVEQWLLTNALPNLHREPVDNARVLHYTADNKRSLQWVSAGLMTSGEKRERLPETIGPCARAERYFIEMSAMVAGSRRGSGVLGGGWAGPRL